MSYAPEGNPQTAQYVFVGEAPGSMEMVLGRPLVGPSGRVFDRCLESAGIPRPRCYLTNLFNHKVWKRKTDNAIFDQQGGKKLWTNRGLTSDAQPYVERLWQELGRTSANVIIPMGNPALEAIADLRGIWKWRGSIVRGASGHRERKVIPTIHPANALHGEYVNQYIITYDLKRCRRESTSSDVERPKYNFITSPTFTQCKQHLQWFIDTKPTLSVDIEVSCRQASLIGYAWTDYDAISIPMTEVGWTLEQEAELWRMTATVLEDCNIMKIMQNGLFDMTFLLSEHGILVPPNTVDDTMIMHHVMYPDFRKGLAFLGSLYTDQPFWKDMVKHGDIDKAEG